MLHHKEATKEKWFITRTLSKKMNFWALKHLSNTQKLQEEKVPLNIRGWDFHTSLMTQDSLYGLVVRKGCPLRPYKWDLSHFPFFLNYLRNGALFGYEVLPREKRHVLERLTEDQFFSIYKACKRSFGQITAAHKKISRKKKVKRMSEPFSNHSFWRNFLSCWLVEGTFWFDA